MSESNVSGSDRCPRCQRPVVPGLLGGHCAACLVDTVWGDTTVAEPAEAFFSEGRKFGAYVLEEELGRGAMGVVFRAWQPSLRRHVAVKLLLGGAFAGAEFTTRFRQEAAVAAGLRHPGLVAIHEAGEVEGQLFYAMEWVEGPSLATRLRQGPLPPREAARLLADTADTVSFAHRSGVVHRDLKPSNLLLDAAGRPRVADFGLARETTWDSDLTGSTDALGSPPYMAPEQAIGGAAVNASSDLYALGAVLYHVLTGRPPFQGASAAQILQQVANEAPIPPRRLNPAVPADLETICLKCLEKEPRHRYASAGALATELRRFLNGEPILARPIGVAGRVWRWARRQPALASALVALAAAVGMGTAGVAWQARRNGIIAGELRREAYFSGIRSASLEWAGGELNRASVTLDALDPVQRGFEWHWLRGECRSPELASWKAHDSIVLSVAVSPDGRWLVTGDQGGPSSPSRVKLWDWATRTLRAEWPVAGQPFSLAFLPDSRRIVAGFGHEGGCDGVVVFDRESGPAKPLQTFEGSVASISADGRRIATVESDFYFYWQHAGRVRVWDLESKRELLRTDGPARSVAISPDGQWVAWSGREGELRQLRVSDGAELERMPLGSEAWSLTYSPDGGEVAGVLAQGHAFRCRGARVETLAHVQRPWSIRFSPDGNHLATAANDYALRLWPRSGAPMVIRGAADEQWCVAWRPQGGELVSGGKDGRLIQWSATAGSEISTRDLPHATQRKPCFSPGGDWMSVDRTLGASTLMETAGTNSISLPDGFLAVWMGPAARDVAAVTVDSEGKGKRLVWFDTRPLREVASTSTEAIADGWFEGSVAFSLDGSRWVEVTEDGALLCREAQSGRVLGRTTVPRPRSADASDSCHLAFSRDGTVAAWSDAFSGEIHLWQVSKPNTRRLVGHSLGVKHLGFSADGSLLASASLDHSIRLWSVADAKPGLVLRGHWAQSNGVAFSPDGRSLASVAHQDSLKFWDVVSGRELCSLPRRDWGESLAFSPDGRWLAIGLSPGVGTASGLRLLRGESDASH